MSDRIVQSVNGTNVSHSLGEGTSKNLLPKWMRTHLIAEHSSSQEASLDSSSHIAPYRFHLEETKLGKGKVAVSRCLSAFGRDCVSENQTCLGIGMFPGQCITEAETRKPRSDCDSFLKLQNYVHDVEKKRLWTTMDDSQGHARVISKSNGDTSSDLHRVTLFLGQGKPKIESQPLSSFIDLDVKEKVRDLEASKVSIKNEFSAETDTMEMESSREKKLHYGSCSTGSTKVLNKKSNLSASWLGLASPVKVESQQLNIELPDMNFPALPENTHPISSKKTRSLEMQTLLGHEEYPNTDPGMRWVKRLKLNSSNPSAQYTKISENQSHENVSNSFSTIPESSAEPTPTKHHDRESNPSDNLMEDPSNKAKGLLLSHAWVQRWLSNRSRIAQAKPETLAVGSQGSRFALERETCPSIAAMALMGKALSCFQPCHFQKRGSLTVWNTNAI